jgi:hypothetical protein
MLSAAQARYWEPEIRAVYFVMTCSIGQTSGEDTRENEKRCHGRRSTGSRLGPSQDHAIISSETFHTVSKGKFSEVCMQVSA